MLQELLMSMTGLPGELIVETETDFVSNPSLAVFSENERPLIDEIAHLGFLYKRLAGWVDKCTSLYHDQLLRQDRTPPSTMEVEGRPHEADDQFIVSRFIRALNFGTREVLDRFYERVLAVEQKFLYGTILNLTEFRVIFREWFETLPELHALISETSIDLFNSCQVLDLLFQKRLSGNQFFREMYGRLFELCWQALLEILAAWALNGKILDGPADQFFVKKSLVRRKRRRGEGDEHKMDWNNDFILNFSLIPRALISVKTAKSVLFLGKMVKVLKREAIFADTVLRVLAQKFDRLRVFDSYEVVQGVNEMVLVVSRVFLEQVLASGKVVEDLRLVRDYFLLFQDEFFNIFVEEAHDRLVRPPTKTAEADINQKVLQNVLLRLNKTRFEHDFKRLKFVLKSKGFDFPNFVDRSSLVLLGDVEAGEFSLRFKPSRGEEAARAQPAVWSLAKHYLEKSFQSNFAFKFRRAGVRAVQDLTIKMGPSQASRADAGCLSLAIQAREEIRANAHSKRLLSLESLVEFVTVNFGIAIYENPQNQMDKRTISYLSVVAKNKESGGQKTLREVRFQPDQVNFADQDTWYAKVLCTQGVLSVFLANERITGDTRLAPLLEVPLQLPELVELDIGRAYVGMASTVPNGAFVIDLNEWSLFCQASQNQGSGWGGLIPFYRCRWPVSIVLNETFFEKCSTLFGLIFPLKLAKHRLGRMHLHLTNLSDRRIDSKFFYFGHHLKCLLDSVVTNLLEYVYSDVIQKEWKRLEADLREAVEFDQLLKAVDAFTDQLMAQTFFDCPQLLQKIFQVVELIDSVDNFVRNESQRKIHDLIDLYRELRGEAEGVIRGILKDLTYVSQTNDSYGRLLLRLSFNGYFERADEF